MYACVCLCVCFVSYVNVFLCLCLCSCLCVPVRVCMSLFLRVRVFGTIFKSFFIKIRDHFGSFLGAFWKWPLRGSRGHFHLVSNFISSLFLTPFCMPLGTHLGAKIAQVGAKMALSCPTWRQDEPKMANLEPKMANLAHFWEHLGNFFCILGAILPKMAKTKKNDDSTALLKVFWGPWAPLGGYVGLS